MEPEKGPEKELAQRSLRIEEPSGNPQRNPVKRKPLKGMLQNPPKGTLQREALKATLQREAIEGSLEQESHKQVREGPRRSWFQFGLDSSKQFLGAGLVVQGSGVMGFWGVWEDLGRGFEA